MAADPSARRADSPFSRLRRAACVQPWILTYHSVGDARHDPYGITVSPGRLDRQLAWLRSRRLTGVGVSALLRADAAARRRLVGLTFDDGYADFVQEALPLLRRYECTATVFVLPGRPGGSNEWDPLGPRKPLLTAREIRRVADAGMEIGSHGLLHRHLTALADEELHAETHRSRELIHEITGTAPEGFCYPYGTVDRRVMDAVRDAGYGYGCALAPAAPLGAFALPRTHVSHADRGVRLRMKELRHAWRYGGGYGPESGPRARTGPPAGGGVLPAAPTGGHR
ncbi:polysaccharide deacetylase family protein [Streptomyces sp. NBC_00654]|uniref:polysaccharide deacetylase family protein n=1 Tax=Streptomyces sp. NBC_00654 TaxID=2975799 RepID=UPI00224FA256|nr:polysaccharide deacetylase family protein [Streptomyces sp. NBC_00654]MCX4966498.1 polysaccharide deacetylase family protein [Streptomyces sp. NBC_00654]